MNGRVKQHRVMRVDEKLLFQAITDFEAYPKFMDEVVGAKVQSRTEKEVLVEFELELVKRFAYTLKFSLNEPTQVSWVLEKSDFFKKNEGAWKLTPQGGEQTEVDYELEVDFGFFVPKWISKKLTEVNLPKMLDTFEKRAMELGKSQ